MKISDIASILNAKVYCGNEHMDKDVHTVCGSDLMSDVLAFVKDQAVLLTGLVNPQVIRTAEMMDIICVVLIRGKTPTEAMIELAEERSLVLMSTDMRMFSACGLLYTAGLHEGGKV